MKSDYKDKLSDEDKKTLDEAIETAKKVISDESADKDKYEAAAKELSDKIMPIGAKMYEQASKEEKPAEEGEKKSDKDEPIEGEVVDEKKEK